MLEQISVSLTLPMVGNRIDVKGPAGAFRRTTGYLISRIKYVLTITPIIFQSKMMKT